MNFSLNQCFSEIGSTTAHWNKKARNQRGINDIKEVALAKQQMEWDQKHM